VENRFLFSMKKGLTHGANLFTFDPAECKARLYAESAAAAPNAPF